MLVLLVPSKDNIVGNIHQRLLQNIENGTVDPMKVDMLEAIKMCIEA